MSSKRDRSRGSFSSSDNESCKLTERKHKKEKRHKKEKKNKKDKKKKHDKRYRESGGRQAHLDNPLTEHDLLEMEAFKSAVQKSSRKEEKLNDVDQAQLLNQSAEYIAEKLGMSKGLIRTHEETLSGTAKYAKSMNYFGNNDEDNPAKRQRLKREHTAQRAIATARAVIAARAKEAVSNAVSAPVPSLSSMMGRFSSSGKQM